MAWIDCKRVDQRAKTFRGFEMNTVDRIMHLADDFASLHRHGGDAESGKARAALLAALQEVAAPQPAQPAPDCRTCLYGRQGDGIWQCDKCVLGDQYQPAPNVVLWRTE